MQNTSYEPPRRTQPHVRSAAPHKRKPFFQRPAAYILLAVVGLVVIIRALLPTFILHKINSYTGTFSSLYGLYIDELDIDLFRMAYTGKNVSGYLKKENFEFLTIKKVNFL
jgi:hypothetical protein